MKRQSVFGMSYRYRKNIWQMIQMLGAISLLLTTPVSARADWPIVFPPFQNQTGDASLDWLATGLPAAAKTKLFKTVFMRAITPDDIREHTKTPGAETDLLHISRVMGAALIVQGSYRISDQSILIEARCIDVASGQPLNTIQTKGSLLEPSQALNDLIIQIAQILRVDLLSETVENIHKPATAVVGAFQACSEGTAFLSAATHSKGTDEKARAMFEKATLLDPTYAEPHYHIGKMEEAAGNMSAAEMAYRAALKADEKYFDARLRLGLLLKNQNRPSEAMLELEQALNQAPENPLIQNVLSSFFFNQYQNTFSEMLNHYQQAIAANPTDADNYLQLGIIYEELNRPAEAEAQYHLAIQKNPQLGDAHYKLGLLLLGNGKNRESVQQFTSAIEHNTQYDRVHFYLGYALTSLDSHPEAIEAFAKAVEAEPTFMEARLELGKAQYKGGRAKEALPTLQEYTQMMPKNGEPYIYIGKIYCEMNQIEQAQEAFKKAIEVDATFSDAHVALGDFYESQKQMPLAAQAYENALRISPQRPDADHLKQKIERYRPK
jgi:tetratricopeptide (TPR) repeat protein